MPNGALGVTEKGARSFFHERIGGQRGGRRFGTKANPQHRSDFREHLKKHGVEIGSGEGKVGFRALRQAERRTKHARPSYGVNYPGHKESKSASFRAENAPRKAKNERRRVKRREAKESKKAM